MHKYLYYISHHGVTSIAVVYKLTSPSQKSYIGITTCIKRRMREYKCPQSRRHQTKLDRAIKKYGLENFEKEVIFESKDYNLVKMKEQEFIKFFDTLTNGYNCTAGGDGGPGLPSKPLPTLREQLQLKRRTQIRLGKNILPRCFG